jgi:hypothetical protein
MLAIGALSDSEGFDTWTGRGLGGGLTDTDGLGLRGRTMIPPDKQTLPGLSTLLGTTNQLVVQQRRTCRHAQQR